MRPTRFLAPILALALAGTLTLPLAACSDSTSPTAPTLATVATTTFAPSLGIDLNDATWKKSTTGLWYRTLSMPTAPGATVAAGDSVTVKYSGYLSTGTLFDSGQFPFKAGVGRVIPGFDEGVIGMQVGERRRLLVPPSLAYGLQNYGPIPGNSVLVFDVEMVSKT
jgi:FKBP-type peptidyl-prolyl cis-trans isomerase